MSPLPATPGHPAGALPPTEPKDTFGPAVLAVICIISVIIIGCGIWGMMKVWLGKGRKKVNDLEKQSPKISKKPEGIKEPVIAKKPASTKIPPYIQKPANVKKSEAVKKPKVLDKNSGNSGIINGDGNNNNNNRGSNSNTNTAPRHTTPENNTTAPRNDTPATTTTTTITITSSGVTSITSSNNNNAGDSSGNGNLVSDPPPEYTPVAPPRCYLPDSSQPRYMPGQP